MKRKKQPYRNTIKKLKRQQEELSIVQNENQRLRESLRTRNEELTTKIKHADDQERKASRMKDVATSELKRSNPYHPLLDAAIQTTINDSKHVIFDDILEYRISSPYVDWQSSDRPAVVKLQFGRRDPYTKFQTNYAISEHVLMDFSNNPYIYQDMINNIGKDIANELLHTAIKRMRRF